MEVKFSCVAELVFNESVDSQKLGAFFQEHNLAPDLDIDEKTVDMFSCHGKTEDREKFINDFLSLLNGLGIKYAKIQYDVEDIWCHQYRYDGTWKCFERQEVFTAEEAVKFFPEIGEKYRELLSKFASYVENDADGADPEYIRDQLSMVGVDENNAADYGLEWAF